MELEYQNNIKQYIGNEEIFDLLDKNIKNNKLQNSIILFGDKGVGKSTLIKILVKKIFGLKNAIDYTYNNSNHENYNHPNFYQVTPLFDEEKKTYKNSILIDQIRELYHFIQLTSFNDLPKIILIDSADFLNNNASNPTCFLGVLGNNTSMSIYFLRI